MRTGYTVSRSIAGLTILITPQLSNSFLVSTYHASTRRPEKWIPPNSPVWPSGNGSIPWRRSYLRSEDTWPYHNTRSFPSPQKAPISESIALYMDQTMIIGVTAATMEALVASCTIFRLAVISVQLYRPRRRNQTCFRRSGIRTKMRWRP